MAKLVFGDRDLPALSPRKGRRVLLLLSRKGTATQEAVTPWARLEEAGVEVVVGSDQEGEIKFDLPCNVLALFERFWSPAYGQYRALSAKGLRARAVDPNNVAWLDGFDAVLIPGGHGSEYGRFITSPFVQQIVHHFSHSNRIVALQCHSVFAATVMGPHGEEPIGAGRQVTCWPAAYERVLGALPLVGRHFLPLGKLTQDLVTPVTGRVHAGANPRKFPHVVIDGNLLTSWGPWSGDLMARAILSAAR